MVRENHSARISVVVILGFIVYILPFLARLKTSLLMGCNYIFVRSEEFNLD